MTKSPRVPVLCAGDKLTRDEFERRYAAMPDVKKAELIEGVVYMGSPVRYVQHGLPETVLRAWLFFYERRTPGLCHVGNTTLRLDLDNEPQPDILLRLPEHAGGRSRIGADGYLEGAPELVIEVAASSTSCDLNQKLDAYRRNGVLEYVVHRVDDGELDWFVLQGGVYVRQQRDDEGLLNSRVFPGLTLDVRALLRSDFVALEAAIDRAVQSPEHAAFVTRALLAPLMLCAVASAQAERLPLTREQMAADLRQLATEATAKWAYADDRRQHAGVDLQQLADTLIARLPDVKDDAAFIAVVREFVAKMRDGHAWVHWDGKDDWPFRRWPFTVADTADGLVIDEVLDTWNGTPAGVQRGDVLIEVNGEPVAALLAAAERRTFASTDGARRRDALRAVQLHDREPGTYKVRRGDGSEVVIDAAAAKRLPEAEAKQAVAHRALADGVAYVSITTFAHHDAKAWAAAAPKDREGVLADELAAIRTAFAAAVDARARALVLDLRGNGGGTDRLGQEAAACLLPKGSVYYGLASNGWFGWRDPSQHRVPARGDPPQWRGKLIVLIDEGVFSVTDNLCRCLDDLHPDVTFVGRPTGGGTGAPRPCVTLEHSRAVVTFCTMRVYGPKGDLIEGRGTQPDVLVRRTRAGVLAGRDEELDAALRLVQ